MKVIGDRIIIKVDSSRKTTKSGFILPIEESNHSYLKGIIVNVGEGVKVQNTINYNEHVLFLKDGINKLHDSDDWDLYLVPSDNVFCILDRDEILSNLLK